MYPVDDYGDDYGRGADLAMRQAGMPDAPFSATIRAIREIRSFSIILPIRAIRSSSIGAEFRGDPRQSCFGLHVLRDYAIMCTFLIHCEHK